MISITNYLLQNRLAQHWYETPIIWDNVDLIPLRGIAFINPVISFDSAQKMSGSKDGGLHRGFGNMTTSVYTVGQTGTRENYRLCSVLSQILLGFVTDTLECIGTYVVHIGNIEEWYQSQLVMNFQFDECTAYGTRIGLMLKDTVNILDEPSFQTEDITEIILTDIIEVSEVVEIQKLIGYGGYGYGEPGYGG